jgi:hypothetical protein
MEQLKKQIRDSFLNPTLYFLPSLIFILIDDFWDVDLAWKFSFPVAFFLIFYVYYTYRRMFLWHGFLSIGYLLIGFGASFFAYSSGFFKYIGEIIFLLLIAFMFLKRNVFEKLLYKTVSHSIPMSNNENELFRMAKMLFVVVLLYLITWLILDNFNLENKEILIKRFQYISIFVVLVIGLFESFRVMIIRTKLINEEWLPIVDDRGKVIGNIQNNPDVKYDKRLTFPVVRLYFIENGMMYLQKRTMDTTPDAHLWDASISSLVKISESIDSTLNKMLLKKYKVESHRFLFLSNYVYHGSEHDQFINLFVSCLTEAIYPQPGEVTFTKWWTQKQIEQNLGSGIFSERFEKEYQIIKRSGLLDKIQCDCDCKLKEVFTNIPAVKTS